jgi:hypothetical protein
MAQRAHRLGKKGVRRQLVDEREHLTRRGLTSAPVQPRSNFEPAGAPKRTSKPGGTFGDAEDAAGLDVDALFELLLELQNATGHHPFGIG